MLLFSSASGPTQGQNWTFRARLPTADEPAMMTSTRSGNLYVLQCSPSTTRIQQYTNGGTTLGLSAVDSSSGCNSPNIPSDSRFKDSGGIAITRLGSYADAQNLNGYDAVRVFIPRLSNGVFVVDVTTYEFRADSPLVTAISTISPAPGYSIRHFSVVEPDLIDFGTGSDTNVAMAFWRELKTTSGAGSERVMYAAIRDSGSISTPTRLSAVAGGGADDWDWNSDIAFWDYAKGTSFWNGTNFQFFGQWTKPVTVGGVKNMAVFTNWVELAD
jgi:hypothetical protein